MLITSELGEALEAARKGYWSATHSPNAALSIEDEEKFKEYYQIHIKGRYEEEIADAIIRLLDHAGYMEIDVNAHVLAKMRYNAMRPYKHGKEF